MGRREVFDPTRSFVANRDFAWGGAKISGGEPFSDKSNPRRLRQLYDGRFLKMLPPEEVVEEEDENDGRPVFVEMTVDEISAWMREHNVVAHPRSTHEALVYKARLLWNELKSGKVRPAKPTVDLPRQLCPEPAGVVEAVHGLDSGGREQPDPPRDSEGVQEPTRQGDAPKRTRLSS